MTGATPYSVHPSGLCETTRVGAGTRIWAFAHVLPGAVIGSDCNICDYVFIENDVRIGDRVTVKSGVQLWDGVELGDDVFVGPNVTFTNDRFPRSRQHQSEVPVIRVGNGASIGANATILPGIAIGVAAMIGAGAVVTKDVPPNAIVYGNPATIRGYSAGGVAPTQVEILTDRQLPELIGGARLIRLRRAEDMRGSLAAVELASDLPFVPRRFFAVFDVPSAEVRGEHAHRACSQFLICLAGSLSALIDDGELRREVLLDEPSIGLYLPPMLWGSQYRFTAEAVLGVFASEPYDPADYIRDYAEYLALRRL
jgi:UDP-2-acetamido-3-amino-2,3-dideoxy-glucuronate N-acetyltransferase